MRECNAGLQHKAPFVDVHNDICPAEVAQCIVPRLQSQPHPRPDKSLMRYDLGSELRSMQKLGQWTDLTIRVQSREWSVHRLVLITCSPVFAAWLKWLDGSDTGMQLDLQCHIQPSMGSCMISLLDIRDIAKHLCKLM